MDRWIPLELSILSKIKSANSPVVNWISNGMEKPRAQIVIHFCEAKENYWQPKTNIRREGVSVGYGDERYVVCRPNNITEAERGLRYGL